MSSEFNPYESPREVEAEPLDAQRVTNEKIPLREIVQQAQRTHWILYTHMVLFGLLGGVCGMMAVFAVELLAVHRLLLGLLAIGFIAVEFRLSALRWEIRRLKISPRAKNVPRMLASYTRLLQAVVAFLLLGMLLLLLWPVLL